ncbi:MAG: isoprenylcysteine carboxylmethyltransferase family protein [Anaerolineales bacterium]|jgi:protein-S-isoprenylcysteine O-methyltransferase Ste14
MVFIILAICWGLFILIWGMGWIYNLVKAPRVEKRSPFGLVSTIGVILIILLVRVAHIYSFHFAISIPDWITIIVTICLIVSTGLTLWARLAIGTMWSNQPETKVGHELRTSGPYQISRHPIYTGMIGMLLASLIVSGLNGLWAIAALIGIIIVIVKIPSEERLMLETFGEQYVEYQRKVPQLLPGFQWLQRAFVGKNKL